MKFVLTIVTREVHYQHNFEGTASQAKRRAEEIGKEGITLHQEDGIGNNRFYLPAHRIEGIFWNAEAN